MFTPYNYSYAKSLWRMQQHNMSTNMAQSMMQPQQAIMMQHSFNHNNPMMQQQQIGMWQQQQQQQGLPHMMNPGMMQGAGALSMYSKMGSEGGLSLYSNMGLGGGGGGSFAGLGMGDMGAAAPAEVKEKETPLEPDKPDLFAGLGDLSAFKKNKPAPTVRADNPFDL
jgi:hypothetical protein